MKHSWPTAANSSRSHPKASQKRHAGLQIHWILCLFTPKCTFIWKEQLDYWGTVQVTHFWQCFWFRSGWIFGWSLCKMALDSMTPASSTWSSLNHLFFKVLILLTPFPSYQLQYSNLETVFWLVEIYRHRHQLSSQQFFPGLWLYTYRTRPRDTRSI